VLRGLLVWGGEGVNASLCCRCLRMATHIVFPFLIDLGQVSAWASVVAVEV
jgi:hypothetical protein